MPKNDVLAFQNPCNHQTNNDFYMKNSIPIKFLSVFSTVKSLILNDWILYSQPINIALIFLTLVLPILIQNRHEVNS